jgi:hypothetical protein
MICVATDADGSQARFSVPDASGALVLKGAAYIADARDRDRHLFDAARLAATISDHGTELDRLKESDTRRLRALRDALADVRHPAWLAPQLPEVLINRQTDRWIEAKHGREEAVFEPSWGSLTQMRGRGSISQGRLPVDYVSASRVASAGMTS